jgi:hypothetical protein
LSVKNKGQYINKPDSGKERKGCVWVSLPVISHMYMGEKRGRGRVGIVKDE